MTSNVDEDRSRGSHCAAAFSELSTMMVNREPLDATLLRVAQLVKDSITEVMDVSVSMVNEDRASTVVFTGATAIELDEAQYELKSGPCLDAAHSGKTVVVANGISGSPYPQFSQLASSRGALQTVSIGLTALDHTRSGLNIYGSHERPFHPAAMTLAQAFANYARAAVAKTLHAGSADSGRLEAAIESRAVIDQAVALLVARHRYSRDQATAEIIATSRLRNWPLLRTAQWVSHE